jgi:murein DD-endopeptidase MepM/ murein hydrolase activator NlpD
MKSNNIPPMLAIELSEVYAWSIDFFALKKGDYFKVVYKESIVDSLSIGITGISFAVFNNAVQNIYAIPFEQDSVMSYFDSTGASLRKAFLKAPLRYSRISSRYSKRRLHPILRIVRPHWGVDYKAPRGTPVLTIGDGIVIMKTYSRAAGNIVKIRHNTIYESSYMHLTGFGKNIVLGARIKQGDIVGFVGSTGLSTGSHLDFRIFKHGKPIDPLKVESPSVDPVHQPLMPAFARVRDSVLAILGKVKTPSLSR